jgi:hypothetical protein
MEAQMITYDEQHYFFTNSKNKISKAAQIKGTDNIKIN